MTGRVHRTALGLAWALALAAPAFGADAPAAPAVTLPDAIVATRADVAAATRELADLRARCDAERAPLSRRLGALEADVRRLRTEAAAAEARRAREAAEMADGEARALAAEEEARFVRGLLLEYRRAFEARSARAELGRWGGLLADLDRELAAESSPTSLAHAASGLLKLAADACRTRSGGQVFDGAALDGAGIERRGRFVLFGPAAYFTADGGPLAGMAVTHLGSAGVSVFERLDATALDAIRALARGAEAEVPVDVSHGDALKVAQARDSLAAHLRKGGVVMIPLLAVGALALLLTVWKAVALGRVSVRFEEPLARTVELVNAGRASEAAALAAGVREPLATLLRVAVAHHRAPREHLEEILHEHIVGVLPALERHLGMLAVLGGVAPLLGLLGTVTGMIHVFQLVTLFGTGDARLLSGGISEALITTEVGLTIAIPVLIFHAYLTRRVRTLVGRLEDAAAAFVGARATEGGTTA